jgi:hypothetical protein
VDTSGMLQMGLQRETQGLEREGTGLGLAVAGPEAAKGLAATAYKEGIAAQQPIDMGEGWYSGGKYFADPYKQQSRLTGAIGKLAGAQGLSAEGEGKERVRQSEIGMHGASAAASAAHAALSKSTMEAGKYQKVKDADGNEYLYNTTTKEFIGAPGTTPLGGEKKYPTTVPKGATESDKAAGFNVMRIMNAGKHIAAMKEETFAPKAPEAFIRALPLAGDSKMGEGLANWSSTPERQVSRQAQRDMIEALVWLDTGAAANAGQVASLTDSHMAALTDSKLSKQYKIDRILGLIEAGKLRAGRAWTQGAEDASKSLIQKLGGLYGDVPVEAGRARTTTGGLPTAAAPTAAPTAGRVVKGNW